MIFVVKVLSQYPEAKSTSEQQISSLGEAFAELVKRLDDGISTVMCLYVFFLLRFLVHSNFYFWTMFYGHDRNQNIYIYFLAF